LIFKDLACFSRSLLIDGLIGFEDIGVKCWFHSELFLYAYIMRIQLTRQASQNILNSQLKYYVKSECNSCAVLSWFFILSSVFMNAGFLSVLLFLMLLKVKRRFEPLCFFSIRYGRPFIRYFSPCDIQLSSYCEQSLFSWLFKWKAITVIKLLGFF